MKRLSREKKTKQARQSLLRQERRVKKLEQEDAELRKLRKALGTKLRKAERGVTEAHAQVILTLPPGAKVHYRAYPCSRWSWIGERTGTVIKAGRKRVLVDYGDRGKLWVYAYQLDEGEGKRDEAQAKTAEEIGKVLGGS